jgi:hypothetical protein
MAKGLVPAMSGVEPPSAEALPKVAAIRSIYGARKCSGSLRLRNSRGSGALATSKAWA